MVQPPHPNNGAHDKKKANTNPFRASDSDAMDIDEADDFLNGPDADDFGSDYETAADDIAVAPPSTSQPDKSRPPPAYSVAQADGREDMELALALSASMDSPALSMGRGTTSSTNAWATQTSSSGLSTASEKAVQRELSWPPPRTNVSGTFFDHERDPPKYSSVASAGGTKSSASNRKPLCVVCQAKPAFNDGYRSFPTCGNTCARLLEEAQQAVPKTKLPPNSNHGRMGNPNRGATSSSSRGTGTGSSSSRGTTSSPIKMCQVCHLRPIYQKGGKVFPTCGLTCAATLHAPGSVPMCDYCHERPKVVINDKIFPHCGRTCRDKAKPAGGAHYYTTRATTSRTSNGYSPSYSPSAPRKATTDSPACTTCILCWAAPRKGAKDDFCSELCKDIAQQQGPFLLEIPRGHASFQAVEQHCIDNWKTKQASYPIIKRIYMVQPHAGFAASYRTYQTHVSSAVGSNRTGNEVRHWISPSRQCSLGDAGSTTPCDSTKCMLCSLVRTSSKGGKYPKGVVTMLELERAVEKATRMAKGYGNILLLSQVLLGNSCEKSKNDLDGPLLPVGYDSIRLVEYTMFGFGGGNYLGENIVFDGRAIKPLYLISFE